MATDPLIPQTEQDLDYGVTLRGVRAGLKVFGRYELIRQLGRGGMGVVWLARDEKLDLEMALKFLPENLVHDEIALDDLRRETKRCMKLTHQHIVHVYDFVTDDATAAIAMEFVDGKSLSALRLEQPHRVFEVAQLTPMLRQVCEALTYAHEHGRLVHYDLKPGNLMLTSGGLVKVMDFGIAASINDSNSRQSRARSTAGMGTLHYMSPQQLGGYPPTVSDDIYSLGATLYEMLTGRPPFHGFRDRALEEQIQTAVPPSLVQRRTELAVEGDAILPLLWDQVVAACLEKEPAKRPQSVAEMWQRLNGAPAGRANSESVTANRNDNIANYWSVDRSQPASQHFSPQPNEAETVGLEGLRENKQSETSQPGPPRLQSTLDCTAPSAEPDDLSLAKGRKTRRLVLMWAVIAVVTVVLTVLVAIYSSHTRSIMEASDRINTKAFVADLKSAISSYYVEYNRFPTPHTDQEEKEWLTDGSNDLLDILMGLPNEGGHNLMNPREIKFVDFPAVKNGRHGVVMEPRPAKLLDTWGNPFRVLMDLDYDNQIRNPEAQNSDPAIAMPSGVSAPASLREQIAIYSCGKDGLPHTTDDIVSWR